MGQPRARIVWALLSALIGGLRCERCAVAAEPTPPPEIQALLKKLDEFRNPLKSSSSKPAKEPAIPRSPDGLDPSTIDAATLADLDLRPVRGPRLTTAEVDKLADYYRALYPLVSLQERLKYEASLPANRPEPKLGESARARIQELEKQYAQYGRNARYVSLQILHSKQVYLFITQEDNFGIKRFPDPAPELLALPEEKILRLPTAPLLTAEHADNTPVKLRPRLPSDGELIGATANAQTNRESLARAAFTAWQKTNNPGRFPTSERLLGRHNYLSSLFAAEWETGFVRDLGHVAGFRTHHISENQLLDACSWSAWPPGKKELAAIDQTQLWQIRQMHLVSLLKFKQPRVYESKNLPALSELRELNAQTRPLDAFEAGALAKLYDGEELITLPHTNRLRMLGSVRATKRCLDCHAVQPGELLGAFVYELIRLQPIKPVGESASGG